VIENESD